MGGVLLGRNTSQGEEPKTKGWSLVSLPLKQQRSPSLQIEGFEVTLHGLPVQGGGGCRVSREQSLGSTSLWGDSREPLKCGLSREIWVGLGGYSRFIPSFDTLSLCLASMAIP